MLFVFVLFSFFVVPAPHFHFPFSPVLLDALLLLSSALLALGHDLAPVLAARVAATVGVMDGITVTALLSLFLSLSPLVSCP